MSNRGCTCTGPAASAHEPECPVRIAHPRVDLGDMDRITDLLDRARELAKTAARRAKEATPPDAAFVACAVALDDAADLIEELERFVLECKPLLWVAKQDRDAAIAWERKMAQVLQLPVGERKGAQAGMHSKAGDA